MPFKFVGVGEWNVAQVRGRPGPSSQIHVGPLQVRRAIPSSRIHVGPLQVHRVGAGVWVIVSKRCRVGLLLARELEEVWENKL